MRNRPENQIEIRLTLIRHGATLSNKEGRYLGKTDEALSPEGIGMLKKAVTGGNYPTADLLFSGPMKRCLETAQILYPGQTPILSRSGRRWISVHSKDTIIRNFPGIRHIRDGSTAAVHCRFRKARAERNSFAETLPDMKNVILHENDLGEKCCI